AACAARDPGENTDRLAAFLHTEAEGEALVELVQAVRRSCLRSVGIAPDWVLPVDRSEIPKTEIGKIQRPLLARRFAEGAFDELRRRMDLLLGNERTLPDWFFRRVWRRCEPRPAREGVGPWLVL